jgi:hypothetical protein
MDEKEDRKMKDTGPPAVAIGGSVFRESVKYLHALAESKYS